jgi:T5SS/PEP-CTERM-associated repeat protein
LSCSAAPRQKLAIDTNIVLCALNSSSLLQGEDFTNYIGTKTGNLNSWFDANLWPEFDGYPNGSDDTAVMDNSDTYAVIDSGDVVIRSLTVAKSAANVALELSSNRALTVTGNLFMGELASSFGKVTLRSNSKLTVGGNITIGRSGSGTFEVDGARVVVDGSFSVGPSFVVELKAGATIVAKGNQLDAFHNYLVANQILPNVGMQSYAIYDVTDDETILRGPQSRTIRSYSCPASPTDMEVVTEFYEGDILKLEKSSGGELCTLVEVSSAAISGQRVLQNMATELGLKPLGRSYNGNDWEPYGGDHSTLHYDCSEDSCRVQLPAPSNGRSYVLKPYAAPALSGDNVKARFLEKATFGPTKQDLANFESETRWLSQQFELPVTSHRAVFRQHMTHWHSESNYNTLLHTHPCKVGARYRRYAFVSVDSERKLTISTTSASKVTLSVDGEKRTVVDGPVQCGNWQGPKKNLGDGTYSLCWNPLDGIHGRVMVRTSNNCDCELFFGGVYGTLK